MRTFSFTSLVLLIGYFAGFLQSLQAEPPKKETTSGWRYVRGNPLQTGVATSDLPKKLEILWRFQAKDAFEGGAAIADGVVYIGNFDQNLYALNLSDGKVKWKYSAGPMKATPSVFKDRVFVGDEDGIFHAVSVDQGRKIWTFETRGEITSTANFFKDKIIFGSYDSTLYCLDEDGKKLWDVVTEGPVNGSPAVVGDKTFVAGCDSALHIIDINTGKESGKVDLGGQAAATAAILGDYLYVGTMTDQVQAIDWQKKRIVWTFEPRKRSQPFFSSAAVNDQLVVVGCRNRKIYAIDRKKGKKIWEFATEGRVDPSPVIVGDQVYAPSMDGKLYVLSLKTGENLQELRLGRSIVGSPAVAERRLVIGTTDGILYCLGEKK